MILQVAWGRQPKPIHFPLGAGYTYFTFRNLPNEVRNVGWWRVFALLFSFPVQYLDPPPPNKPWKRHFKGPTKCGSRDMETCILIAIYFINGPPVKHRFFANRLREPSANVWQPYPWYSSAYSGHHWNQRVSWEQWVRFGLAFSCGHTSGRTRMKDLPWRLAWKPPKLPKPHQPSRTCCAAFRSQI